VDGDKAHELLLGIRLQIESLEHQRGLAPFNCTQQRLYDWLIFRERELIGMERDQA